MIPTGLIVFAVLLLLFIILYKSVGLYYAINDDTTMQKLAAGSITGSPDGHLVFIKYVLGAVLAGLFSVFPGIDWYGIAMTGLMFLCFFLIIMRILYLAGKRKNRAAACITSSAGILAALYLLADSLILFQFTLVAGMLGATALFYLASSDAALAGEQRLLFITVRSA